MKFLKPVLLILTIFALTYTVSANNVSFNKLTKVPAQISNQHKKSGSLPVHGDLIFAITAIATLGGYMAFKK